MASEKHIQLDTDYTMQPLRPASNSNRRKIMIALGGAAVLATGMAAGLGMSMFCGRNVAADLRLVSSPPAPSTTSLNHSNAITNLFSRDLVGMGSGYTVSKTDNTMGQGRLALGKVRPIKYFGPKLTPAQAAVWKAVNHAQSIEKKDVAEEVEDIEARGLLSTATTDSASVSNTVHRVWQPSPGTNWTYQLNQPPTAAQLQNPSQYQVWDIDLFDTPASTIQTIQAAGSKVICYFSGGTWENWRSDANQFQSVDIGAPLGAWPGEYWLNTNSASVRKIMAARLDLAKQKGCDGVDPDNMDIYNYATGFNPTQQDAINYVSYLSQQAQTRGMAISLKNAGDIISSVINMVQYSVEEACYAYSECNLYAPFTKANKAVFHVEYPKGYGVVNNNQVSASTMSGICQCIPQFKLSPIVKNNDLGNWQQQCS